MEKFERDLHAATDRIQHLLHHPQNTFQDVVMDGNTVEELRESFQQEMKRKFNEAAGLLYAVGSDAETQLKGNCEQMQQQILSSILATRQSFEAQMAHADASLREQVAQLTTGLTSRAQGLTQSLD